MDFDMMDGGNQQPLCQVHHTFREPMTLRRYQPIPPPHHYNTHIPVSKYTATAVAVPSWHQSTEDQIPTDLPQRPMLGQMKKLPTGNKWATSHDLGVDGSQHHQQLVASHSMGNIYSEVDPKYEGDSGYTEEGGSSDINCDQKEDTSYTSGSSNSNYGYYQQQAVGVGGHEPYRPYRIRYSVF